MKIRELLPWEADASMVTIHGRKGGQNDDEGCSLQFEDPLDSVTFAEPNTANVESCSAWRAFDEVAYTPDWSLIRPLFFSLPKPSTSISLSRADTPTYMIFKDYLQRMMRTGVQFVTLETVGLTTPSCCFVYD